MATETDTSVASWTPETLKQLFAALHNDLKDSIADRFAEGDLRYEQRWEATSSRVENEARILQTRLDAMDKASIILSENVNRVPTLLDRSIATVSALTDEKFAGVQRQFAERDVRGNESQKAAETAVNAALASQKEAVAQQNNAYAASGAKAEAATAKQIDSIVALLTSQSTGLNDKISDLNRRMERGEGTHSANQSNTTNVTGFVVAGVAVLALLVSLLPLLTQHNAPGLQPTLPYSIQQSNPQPLTLAPNTTK